jgi:hypothetical protein
MSQSQLDLLVHWVGSVLRRWDAIGVGNLNTDEYDSYAPKIAAMLLNGANAFKIAEHLFRLETVAMGLAGDRGKCEEIGQILHDGFTSGKYRHLAR